MEKQIQFFGRQSSGINCRALFGSSGVFEKTAGAPPFADWETGEELRNYLRGITSEDRKRSIYVLVNALGAGEYFGSNINADFFPWDALSHKGTDYGYETFLAAHAFQHHKNKDPSRAFGVPVLSVLNQRMKRIELIIRLDREKAKIEGADSIITRIEGGEFPDVSMGCKVPYDICSICGQKSKTRFDYCEHMHPPEELRHKYGPNKILADGRKIYVRNTLPRFFDISFVFIGADKTAKVMAKIASKGRQICLGDICAIPRPSAEIADIVRSQDITPSYTEKVASDCHCGGSCCDDTQVLSLKEITTTHSSFMKIGEMTKEVPANGFFSNVLPKIEKEEQNIPNPILDDLADSATMDDIISSAGMLGIVFKPHEFQRMVLSSLGKKDLAERLHREHKVFRETNHLDTSLAVDKSNFKSAIADKLLPLLKARSALGKPFQLRMVSIKLSSKKTLPTETPIEDALLDKISAAYNGYRQNLFTKISQTMEVVNSDPKLKEEFLGSDILNMFSKTASIPIVSFNSVAYIMGAHFQNRSLIVDSEDYETA